ncbi:MAG: tRNA (N(6)-L-threonylcarbamoyladenosine(37)-C(2))-methylthiotransferase MtaB [Desulfobacter postgatei]|uniref:tRNA (N(6)-L-threonylcarbamoyladenosine(37)-C(2))- methylthiotransferase MtaB n=1 Tax=Desulfobacter postgatei TaxID=2293 RepID=UPI0023EFF2E7|nr:tRNA (N(6)-L-threonylcarbamoyladenosine(37)-C(2))-methylthiotransferase MtaB [Desulfobacter postgatei]MDD4274682.1 tRNA (N(6)-L-threonylcarbamoyladenosine(37)-C(2))-methylthiotransferase MtaB [Desulfobacter postgatei]
MKKKTFYIESLGCKVNQYESDGIAAQLEAQGFSRAGQGRTADICIVNTCAVTARAGMQSRQETRKLIREHPDATVIVTGCHAQTDPEQFKKISGVNLIVCHQDKNLIPAYLARKAPEKDLFEFRKPEYGKKACFVGFDQPVYGTMTRAYLKIQDGCNQFCTYCIIPYARGASVSMPFEQVMAHISGLNGQGFKEIILTGIHTGLYGLDLKPETSLTQLVKTLDDKKTVDQIRISSIEPNEITDDLINMARPGHILCDHFHIPLQAGDDGVLSRMKRPYSVEQFSEVIHKIHEILPHAGIGLDLIMGFPGETDKAFENTYKLVAALPVSYLHVFPYSPRKGTPAWHFTPKVPSNTAKKRAALMRELGEQKRSDFIKSNQGRILKGLIQNQGDRQTGMLKAVTTNYLTVFIKNEKDTHGNPDNLKGQIVNLKYDQCSNGNCLVCRIVS